MTKSTIDIAPSATVDPAITMGYGVRVGERAVVVWKPLPSINPVSLFPYLSGVKFPDDSYSEIYCLRLASGVVTNVVVVMWLPSGVYVKPGCRPLESIKTTIRRLEHIEQTHIWRGSTYQKQRAAKWLTILRRCQQYEWSAT